MKKLRKVRNVEFDVRYGWQIKDGTLINFTGALPAKVRNVIQEANLSLSETNGNNVEYYYNYDSHELYNNNHDYFDEFYRDTSSTDNGVGSKGENELENFVDDASGSSVGNVSANFTNDGLESPPIDGSGDFTEDAEGLDREKRNSGHFNYEDNYYYYFLGKFILTLHSKR